MFRPTCPKKGKSWQHYVPSGKGRERQGRPAAKKQGLVHSAREFRAYGAPALLLVGPCNRCTAL